MLLLLFVSCARNIFLTRLTFPVGSKMGSGYTGGGVSMVLHLIVRFSFSLACKGVNVNK